MRADCKEKINLVRFMKADCKEKIKIAKNYKIDYIYSPEFNCRGFELEGVSEEGLYLYEVV